MKKFQFILAAASLFLISSCDSKKDDDNGSDKAKQNLAATRTVSEAFMSGDISKIDSVVASDFVDHTDRGDMGRDSLKAMIKANYASSKDMKMEAIKEVADDEYVFSWMRFTGTSDGTMGGMPAGPYDMNAIEVIKFKDGKAIEHWTFMQPTDMMKMMSGAPQNSKPANIDTPNTRPVKDPG